MGPSRNNRLAKSAVLLAVLVMAGCGSGNGEGTTRPSAGAPERSINASPEPTLTRSAQPTRSRTAELTPTPAQTTTTTRPATAVPAPPGTTPAETTTTTRPATAVPAPPGPTRTLQTTTAPAKTENPATTPTASAAPAAASSAAPAAAAAESGGLGPYGWLLLIGLLAALGVGGFLVYRSQQKSSWDAEARTVGAEAHSITAIRLPPVLTTTTIAQRALVWPPIRAGLADLVRRCDVLSESALGEPRRNWTLQLSALLRDLIAAVDAENEALTAGRDWMVLRPQVDQVLQMIAAVLANQLPEPPSAGEPGPPAYQI